VNLHSAFTLFGRKNSTLDDQITTYLTRNFNSIKNLNDFGIINDQTTWGINAKVLHHAMDSVKLYEITMNRTYLDRAIHHMYWVLGNNPFEKCFIVGIGQDSYAIEKMYGLQERNINGGVVPGPIVNEDGDLVYHDCNSKKKSCWVYDEATIDATAIGMWMFTEMMNATRYNSLL
jgi:hypothetical protein